MGNILSASTPVIKKKEERVHHFGDKAVTREE